MKESNRFLVAPIANQLAASFVDWNLKVRQQQALGTRRFLPMTKAKAGLEEEERQLEAFKIKHVGSTPDQLEANLQALSRLEAELQSNMDAISRLDEERILLSGVRSIEMNETAAPKRPGALTLAEESSGERTPESEAAVQGNISRRCSSVGQLRSVNARLAPMPVSAEDSAGSFDSNTEVRLQLISKGMQRLRRHQAALQQQIGSYQGKIDPVPVLEIQLAEPTRNYETSRQKYQSLLDKTLSAGMSEDHLE
jgi:succinoglycan biosynthesis transport protein ExoP